jgi:3-dehydroquinate dehydratase/shikimate dehydrogenase
MICAIIKGPTLQAAHQQMKQAYQIADLVELRLDGFTDLNEAALKALKATYKIPVIFTLRDVSQGGHYQGTEAQRLAEIRRLAALEPDYLDLEHHVMCDFVEEISRCHPKIKLILSYHDMTKTPEDLDRIYEALSQKSAYLYKIAVTAQQSIDTLRLLNWAKTVKQRMIAISLGTAGQPSRVMGSIFGCPFTYATLDDMQQTAPGQFNIKTLTERYRYSSLNDKTAIYGLIGDPVDQSVSDVAHNHVMGAYGLGAVYVKMPVKAAELGDFLQQAKQLPMQGLSVTMPLKEAILPYLDKIDPQAREIGAVNTLLFKKGEITGFNTDGIGALNALEKVCVVKGKRIILIGAGGAAKSIAYEACRRGGVVTVLNRDAEKAHQLARRLQCEGGQLDDMKTIAKQGYDVLINCTPLPMPIKAADILPQTVVMDIKTKPNEIPFLQCAERRRCQIIYGYRMFVEQAVGQYQIWFNERVDLVAIREALEQKARECVFS